MGYLKRVGPKRYRYAYEGPRVNGKRQQLTGTFYDLCKTEAEAKLAQLEAEAPVGEHVSIPNLTLKQLLNEFMEKKKLTLAVSTYERYAMLARLYIIPRLSDIKVRDMRQGDLVNAYSKLLANGSGKKPVSGRTGAPRPRSHSLHPELWRQARSRNSKRGDTHFYGGFAKSSQA
jgi:hypothetical protein